MMKRTKQKTLGGCLTALILALIVILPSCEGVRFGNKFLAKAPGEDVTLDTVFSRAVYAKQFLWHAYVSLPYGYGIHTPGPYDSHAVGDNDPLAALTDIDQSFNDNNGGAATYYYTGSYNAAVQSNHGSSTKYDFYNAGAWKGIRQAYIFINNVDKVPDMDEQTKKRLKAEARMIIAVHYVDLFRNFGGMIWVNHAYGPNENFHLPRLTARATLDSTLALINKAIPDLPFTLSNPAVNEGRFTQAGAMGLKVRLLLFAASPLFNSSQPYMTGLASTKKLVWFGGYDPALWQKTVDACKAFLQKNQQEGMPYHLVNTGNPQQDFLHGYFDRSSPELLISVQKIFKGSGGGNGFPQSLIAEGTGCTTDNYVKMFPMADGTPITDPNSGYDPTHPYKNRDPRLYQTVLTNGAPYQNRTAELWIGGKEHKTKEFRTSRTGYREYKFCTDLQLTDGLPLQWPYLRLSEIYLSYAEALDEANNGPTAEAYKYVNMVRNRVGLNDLPGGLSKEDFLKAVLRERALELGYENVRWFDMVRWKMKDVFTKTLYGMYIYNKDKPSAANAKDLGYGYHESSDYIYVRYKLPDRYWKDHFSPKWYLSAFPKKEINKKYGLIQNPGW